jgi:hypothetical protein
MSLLLMLSMEKFLVAAAVHELSWLAEHCPRLVQQQQQPTCIIAPPPSPYNMTIAAARGDCSMDEDYYMSVQGSNRARVAAIAARR